MRISIMTNNKGGGIVVVIVFLFIVVALLAIFSWGQARQDEIDVEAQEFIDAGCSPASSNLRGEVTYWNCPPGTPDSVGQ
jgi:hypothetical protein